MVYRASEGFIAGFPADLRFVRQGKVISLSALNINILSGKEESQCEV